MTKTSQKNESQNRDLGFGSRSLKDSGRLITKTGDYNTSFAKKGLGQLNLYYDIIHMSWGHFFLWLIAGYVLLNLFFGSIYYMIGVENLSNGGALEGASAFYHCFYFSTQTLTTVGFGTISPIGHATNLVAAFEAMIGLLAFAFGTGVTYGRFSKAKTKILFSDKALITTGKEGTLKLRFVNRKQNRLIGMSAKLTISYLVDNEETGKTTRSYDILPLELSYISLFPLPWTIVHKIDDASPLFKKNLADLKAMDAELVVILAGYDDTFDQQVHRINSYKAEEFVFNHKFKPMFGPDEASGTTRIEINKLSQTSSIYD